jgi:hypothetical protein
LGDKKHSFRVFFNPFNINSAFTDPRQLLRVCKCLRSPLDNPFLAARRRRGASFFSRDFKFSIFTAAEKEKFPGNV